LNADFFYCFILLWCFIIKFGKTRYFFYFLRFLLFEIIFFLWYFLKKYIVFWNLFYLLTIYLDFINIVDTIFSKSGWRNQQMMLRLAFHLRIRFALPIDIIKFRVFSHWVFLFNGIKITLVVFVIVDNKMIYKGWILFNISANNLDWFQMKNLWCLQSFTWFILFLNSFFPFLLWFFLLISLFSLCFILLFKKSKFDR